jgi:hypothetical protein
MSSNINGTLPKNAIALAAICLILSTPTVLLGWGSGGHMMVAHIAFGRLNPNAKAQVQKLLAVSINPPDVTAKSLDFLNASHWADDVKHLTGFEFSGDLHFIDIPFSTDRTKLPRDLPKPENIVKALGHYVDVLKTSTDQNEQAQALRFIIHFVGDIHQPLHCATKVDKKHIEGDRGGNDLLIKVRRNGMLKPVKLHSYWDGGIDTFPKEGPGPTFTPPPLSQIHAAAATATNGNPDTDPALKLDQPFDFQGWADESNKLAREVAYKNAAKGKEPNAAYRKAAVKVARKRVAFGGYRLAALLNAIWP